MNSKDMCMIEHIPELIEAGVSSFKIEGRAKTEYYTAVVTNAYRSAVDAYLAAPSNDFKPTQWMVDEVYKISFTETTAQASFSALRATMPRYIIKAAMSAAGKWRRLP